MDVTSAQASSPDRQLFSAYDIARDIWFHLGLPSEALNSLSLPEKDEPSLSSSYKIGPLAQSTIGLSALGAALVSSLRQRQNGQHQEVPKVSVNVGHAVMDFLSVRLYKLNRVRPEPELGPIGGQYETADGHVRIQDMFPNLLQSALRVLGLPLDADRSEVADRVLQWSSKDLERAGLRENACIFALRSYAEWDELPQARALGDFPISIEKIGDGPIGLPKSLEKIADGCFAGLKVLEMSRVIAAPLAGRTLALHGADVIWVTPPTLPSIPFLDRDMGRGKRRAYLSADDDSDNAKVRNLAQTCDVFIQNHRPGSLVADGLSPEELAAENPGIIIANLSAFGPDGPWAAHCGFDFLVQTASGMSVSEAQHYGSGEVARVTPCQPLDYGAGYLLAAGISAAMYRRATQGGSYVVNVSLAGVMKYLRSLGQYPKCTGFNGPEFHDVMGMVPDALYEIRDISEGQLQVVKHAAQVDGRVIDWNIYSPLSTTDNIQWLSEPLS